MIASIVSLGWLLLIFAAAHGYGHLLAGGLKLDLPSRFERGTLAVGFGLGVLVVATFVLGLAHRLGRGPALLLVLPAAAFTIAKVVAALPLRRPFKAAARSGWGRLALMVALGTCVLANLIGTLAPPSFIDALVYHLFIARTYLQAGGIIELPSIWQSYQPLGMEMLFTLGFALQGAVLAALIHTGLGVLSACATALLARRVAGTLGGWLAAAIFYCTAMIAWESTSCFVELGITAFSTLGIYAVIRWADDEQPRWLIAAGLLLGLAGIFKLTAIQFSFLAALLVAWVSWRRQRGFLAIAGRAAALVGIAVALCVPWYVHAYAWTGNPIYPFGTKLFGANSEYDKVWAILRGYGPGHGIGDLLLAPWRLYADGALFEAAQYLSPLPFIWAPLILLRFADREEARDRRLLLGAIVAGFVLWLSSAHVARYLIPLQPLLAVLAADAAIAAARRSRAHLKLIAATGVLVLGFGTLSTLLMLKTLAPVVLGRESTDAYLTRTTVFYTAFKMVEADVPANGLILTNQGPTLYLDRPHVRIKNSDFLAGPERLGKVLDSAPFTHIFLQGDFGMEAPVRALGPRVRLIWRRDFDVPSSRTFNETKRFPASLYEVVR